MSFTPGARSYGSLEGSEFNAGFSTPMGFTVEPGGIYVVRHTRKRQVGARASLGVEPKSLAMVISTYPGEDPANRAVFEAMIVWTVSKDDFAAYNIDPAGFNGALDAEGAVALVINWTDACALDRFCGVGRLCMDGSADLDDPCVRNYVGIAEVGSRKNGRLYVSDWRPGEVDWAAVVASRKDTDAVKEFESPPADLVPFRSLFSSQPTLPTADFQDGPTLSNAAALTGSRLRIGSATGLRFVAKYLCGTEVRYAVLQNTDLLSGVGCISGHHAYMSHQLPQPAKGTYERLVAPSYHAREVLIGHRDLILSCRPVEGGVPFQDIVDIQVNVNFDMIPFLDKDIAAAAMSTATLGVATDGQLFRLDAPTMYENLQTARSLLCPACNQLETVAKATISRELEARAAGSETGLGCLRLSFPGFSLALFLSLAASRQVAWCGDRGLTLKTPPNFDSFELSKNVGARAVRI